MMIDTKPRLALPTFEDACMVLGVDAADYRPDVRDVVGFHGHGWWEVRGPDGELKQLGVFTNLVTQVGDQYYMERAAGIASPPGQVTGMRLGDGTTAPAKTGAGAAIVTYTSAITAAKAIDGGFPTSALVGSARRIQWKTSWAAGEATHSGFAEVVITNESPLTDVAGSAANTISRALVSPVANKGSLDTLSITWNHDGAGA
jgi:hypothetical protein